MTKHEAAIVLIDMLSDVINATPDYHDSRREAIVIAIGALENEQRNNSSIWNWPFWDNGGKLDHTSDDHPLPYDVWTCTNHTTG